MRVKCLAQEQNIVSPTRAGTRTTQSQVKRANHEAKGTWVREKNLAELEDFNLQPLDHTKSRSLRSQSLYNLLGASHIKRTGELDRNFKKNF